MSSSYYAFKGSRRPGPQGRNYQNRTPHPSGGRRGQYIDPARFVAVARVTEQEEYVPKHQFLDFDIEPLLKTNLTANGYVTPSPIQDQTIPMGLLGKYLICMA